MRVYQAGPMRHIDQYNFNAFEDGKDYLQWLGHDVVSPHDIDLEEELVRYTGSWRQSSNPHLGPSPDQMPSNWIRQFDSVWLTADFTMEHALKRDIAALMTCKAISLLPGWEHSQGATFELYVAERCGLEVYRHAPWRYFVEYDDLADSCSLQPSVVAA